MEQQIFNKESLTEVYPWDLGNYRMFDRNGQELGVRVLQDIFNAPMWKSYFLGEGGRFVYSDSRTGKVKEYKIVQFVK